MRSSWRVSCVRRGLSVVGLAFLAASALTAERPAAGNGSYAGEAVVRSVGDRGILVALDETGAGLATRLFYAEARGPVAALALRSPGARVEISESGLAVTLPREGRVLRLDLAPIAHRPGARRPAPAAADSAAVAPPEEEGFLLTRIAPVASLAEYEGDGRSLDALETADAAGGFLRSLSGQVIIPIEHPPDLGDGGGCSTACKTLCPNGCQCNLNCSSGCAYCGCTDPYNGTCNCYCS